MRMILVKIYTLKYCIAHSDDNSSLKGLSVLRKLFVFFLHLPSMRMINLLCLRTFKHSLTFAKGNPDKQNALML